MYGGNIDIPEDDIESEKGDEQQNEIDQERRRGSQKLSELKELEQSFDQVSEKKLENENEPENELADQTSNN